MKTRLFTFLIIILSSCSSSRQVLELQNKVEELENTLSDEKQKNRVLSSFRFFIDNGPPCRKGMREVKPYSGTYDSLCTMYNNLLDKRNNLKVPALAFEKDFDIHFAKSDSIISRLRTEYKSIKKSPK
jgi:hypothetical protein